MKKLTSLNLNLFLFVFMMVVTSCQKTNSVVGPGGSWGCSTHNETGLFISTSSDTKYPTALAAAQALIVICKQNGWLNGAGYCDDPYANLVCNGVAADGSAAGCSGTACFQ